MLSTIEDLPCEVLENIFTHLPLALDQQQLTLVCKKMELDCAHHAEHFQLERFQIRAENIRSITSGWNFKFT